VLGRGESKPGRQGGNLLQRPFRPGGFFPLEEGERTPTIKSHCKGGGGGGARTGSEGKGLLISGGVLLEKREILNGRLKRRGKKDLPPDRDRYS